MTLVASDLIARPTLGIRSGAVLTGSRRLSLSDYGLTGFGDETAAVQAAFDAIPSGSTIYVPAVYTVSDDITISKRNLTIEGVGGFTQTGANKKTLNFTDPVGITVRGPTFVGRGTEHNGVSTSYNGVAAIYFDGPRQCVVEDCTLSNHAGGGVRWKNANGLFVRSNTITGIGAAGGIESGDNNGDFAIGSYASDADYNVEVIGNTISGHCFGIGASRGRWITIRSNTIQDIPGQHGAYLSAMSGVTCEQNTFVNIALEGFKNQISTNDTTVDTINLIDNTFTSIGSAAVVISPTGGTTGASFTGVFLDRLTITGVGTYGLALTNVVGFVGLVTIADVAAYAIYCNGFEGTFAGGTIDTSDWVGIWIEADGPVTIRDMTLIDCAANAGEEAAHARYQQYIYVTANTGSNHLITIADLTLDLTGEAPDTLDYAIRTHSSVVADVSSVTNNTGKSNNIANAA